MWLPFCRYHEIAAPFKYNAQLEPILNPVKPVTPVPTE
jgi:hypothetical protein